MQIPVGFLTGERKRKSGKESRKKGWKRKRERERERREDTVGRNRGEDKGKEGRKKEEERGESAINIPVEFLLLNDMSGLSPEQGVLVARVNFFLSLQAPEAWDF